MVANTHATDIGVRLAMAVCQVERPEDMCHQHRVVPGAIAREADLVIDWLVAVGALRPQDVGKDGERLEHPVVYLRTRPGDTPEPATTDGSGEDDGHV